MRLLVNSVKSKIKMQPQRQHCHQQDPAVSPEHGQQNVNKKDGMQMQGKNQMIDVNYPVSYIKKLK